MADKAIKANAVIKPRGISRDLTVQQPGLYRAGMYQELQKFGKTPKGKEQARQLLLTEGLEGTELDSQIEITGLDLTVAEDKALHACLRLLDQTGYQGNLPPLEMYSQAYRGSYTLPRLQISWPEYLEAYGLQGNTKGKARKDAIDALEALQQPRRIVYSRRRPYSEKGKKLYEAIVTQSPVIKLSKIYPELDEEEMEQLRAGHDLPGRVTSLVIEFSPLLIDRIESFYLLKPVGLFDEIEEYLGSKRYSPAVSLFAQWLLTKNYTPVRIAKELLAEKLRLHALLEQRKPSLLQSRLQQAIDTSLAMELLLGYDQDDFGVYTFHLNPERCLRIASSQPAEDEEQEL